MACFICLDKDDDFQKESNTVVYLIFLFVTALLPSYSDISACAAVLVAQGKSSQFYLYSI